MRTPAQWSKECIRQFGYGVDHKLIDQVQREAICESAGVGLALTHPTIHGDYYEWLGTLSDFERKFVEKCTEEKNWNGLMMFAWSRSRETVTEKIRGQYPPKKKT